MKTTLLAIMALAVSTSVVCADSAFPSHLGLAPIPTAATAGPASHEANVMASVPSLTLADGREAAPAGFKLESSSSSFAQLGGTPADLPLTMPFSSGLVLTFVAIGVLALRIMGLNHARAMADHERDSYHGKARMFRTLHEGGADH